MVDQKASPNVDPAIFQFLQDKIDEEGKIRDVLNPTKATSNYTDNFTGAQRDRPDLRETR
jgi:hypothetical protein